MNCPKCMAEVMDDALFCPKCGAPVSAGAKTADAEDMDRTMSIPFVRTAERTVSSVQPSQVKSRPAAPVKKKQITDKKADKKREKNDEKKGVLIFLVVFLATVVVVLSAVLIVVLVSGDTPPDNGTNVAAEVESMTSSSGKEAEAEEEPEDFPEGESVAVEEEKKGVPIDMDFSFKSGVELSLEEISYKTLKGSDYRCDVPAGFGFVYDEDGEIRYGEKEGTAYMDIGSVNNSSSLSLDEIRSKALSDLAGRVTAEEGGEGWYSVTVDRGGIIYHHKCFADERTILYYEMVYPSEYSEVYSLYTSDIDRSFVRN